MCFVIVLVYEVVNYGEVEVCVFGFGMCGKIGFECFVYSFWFYVCFFICDVDD